MGILILTRIRNAQITNTVSIFISVHNKTSIFKEACVTCWLSFGEELHPISVAVIKIEKFTNSREKCEVYIHFDNADNSNFT